jgi:AT-hook transcription factor
LNRQKNNTKGKSSSPKEDNKASKGTESSKGSSTSSSSANRLKLKSTKKQNKLPLDLDALTDALSQLPQDAFEELQENIDHGDDTEFGKQKKRGRPPKNKVEEDVTVAKKLGAKKVPVAKKTVNVPPPSSQKIPDPAHPRGAPSPNSSENKQKSTADPDKPVKDNEKIKKRKIVLLYPKSVSSQDEMSSEAPQGKQFILPKSYLF